ncbi:MAG: hypothetical protein SFU87_06330 [Chitinophagaceae bacterium]|nr:hypothetical protein [Chitinophagaceae bacterium]
MQTILLLVAVTTVIGHSIFPHIHHNEETPILHGQHDESTPGKHHHDENSNDNRHVVLSFAQMEDSYIPANRLIKNFGLPVEFIPFLTAIICTDNFPIDTKTHFGWYKEYPPPDNPIRILSFRGPPSA